jgi:two-component system sensor kinase FixL
VTTLETLAHELRQPLGAILSNAQAAQRLLSTGNERAVVEVSEILAEIVACDQRAAQILRSLEEALRSAGRPGNPDGLGSSPGAGAALRREEGDAA